MSWWRYGFLVLCCGLLEMQLHGRMESATPVLLLVPPLRAGIRHSGVTVLACWWFSGVVRDLLLGPWAGFNTLAFLFMGACAVMVRDRLSPGHPVFLIMGAWAGMGFLRASEATGVWFAGSPLPEDFFLSVVAGACLLASAVVAAALCPSRHPRPDFFSE